MSFTQTIYASTFADFSVGAPESGAVWEYFTAGEFMGNDGTTAHTNGLLQVNPTPQAFVSTMSQSGYGGLDHVKWLAYHNQTFEAPRDDCDLVYEMRLSGKQNFNIDDELPAMVPVALQAGVTNAQRDIRLCSGAMNCIDEETWCVCDTFFSNDVIYAFVERLPFGKPGWPSVPTDADGDYHAYSCCVPIYERPSAYGSSSTIDPLDDMVTVQMRYSYQNNSMTWVINGVEKYKYSGFGVPLGREHRILDHGGPDVIVHPQRWKFGFGLFTLLDMHNPVGVANPDDSGLVAIATPIAAYPNTITVHPRKMGGYKGTAYAVDTYIDEDSLAGNRLFYQGAQLAIQHVNIFSTNAL